MYSGLVHGLIYELVRDSDQVEDLAQEAFCTAYESLPDLRRPARFSAWLAERQLGAHLSTVVGRRRPWGGADKKRLRQQVLAALPALLWSPLESGARQSWWSQPVFTALPSLSRRAILLSTCAAVDCSISRGVGYL